MSHDEPRVVSLRRTWLELKLRRKICGFRCSIRHPKGLLADLNGVVREVVEDRDGAVLVLRGERVVNHGVELADLRRSPKTQRVLPMTHNSDWEGVFSAAHLQI